jgi:hypothetical protein
MNFITFYTFWYAKILSCVALNFNRFCSTKVSLIKRIWTENQVKKEFPKNTLNYFCTHEF